MKKAFTLIELLIVIAILAILAIGVLAAIDPIEQFNRGRDSTSLNTAAEYKNAVDRFYAGQGAYPPALKLQQNAWLTQGSPTYNAITDMVAAGELKTSFTAGGNIPILTNINVDVPANGATPIICVYLQSKTFRNNSSATFDYTGSFIASPTCPNPTGAGCHICYF